MKKIHKIISICAAVVILTGVSLTVVRASTFGDIKDKIGFFIFGAKGKNDVQKQCLKDALAVYRSSLKEGRDAFVQASNDFRVGYKQAVGAAVNDLRNAPDEKQARGEKKIGLKATRKSALKDWGDKLQAARANWQAAQKIAIENYRVVKEKCLEN